MKKASYTVVNGNGNLIKFFGSDYHGAVSFCKENEGCGLMYCLRVKKQFLTV